MSKIFNPVEAINRSISAGRFPHAVLLCGHNKIALEEIAVMISSKLLNIPSESVKEHPDFFSLRATNKMRQISIENTRKLIVNIQRSPSHAEHKVAVIYEAEKMNTFSANAFLKTLEEPPSNTTIILLTTRPYSIIETIRSRCLHFNFLTQIDSLNEPEWNKWKKNYISWIQSSATGIKSLKKRSEIIIRLYALVDQFSSLLEKISGRRWEILKEEFKCLSYEDYISQKIVFQKDIRQQIFRNLAETTRDFALQGDNNNDFVAKLIKINWDLEYATELFDVNLNECLALEFFLLQLLRSWGTK